MKKKLILSVNTFLYRKLCKECSNNLDMHNVPLINYIELVLYLTQFLISSVVYKRNKK